MPLDRCVTSPANGGLAVPSHREVACIRVWRASGSLQFGKDVAARQRHAKSPAMRT